MRLIIDNLLHENNEFIKRDSEMIGKSLSKEEEDELFIFFRLPVIKKSIIISLEIMNSFPGKTWQ